MLSVLGGALFQFWVGLAAVLFCCGFGALGAYTISKYLGHPIVEKYLSARIDKLEKKVSYLVAQCGKIEECLHTGGKP